MQTFCIIASGQSLKDEDVAYVKAAREQGKCRVIAISNVGIDKAPWADYLVSSDTAWWMNHPEALLFEGIKVSRHRYRNTTSFSPSVVNGCNSGLMAMEVANKWGDASRILLLGFDMHGTHYFGKHSGTLKNTTQQRFRIHIAQFKRWNGCEVINCTENSALKKFPFSKLQDVLL